MATAYERVRIARGAKRPTGIDYLQNVFHGFFELHGDRRYADDPAIVGGLAYLGATPVTVIAIEKGHTAKERVQRGFGAPQPEGYRKALRLMRQAEKFHRPVVCFVDTSGAGCNVGAEERGQGEAIAECLTTMSALQTPVLSILIGEGGSGGALALAAGDRVWMLENAVYSVISPEGCATILWKDAAKAEQAAEELKLTADDALALGVVESVIPEAGLGEPEFYDALSQRLMREVVEVIAGGNTPADLVEKIKNLSVEIGKTPVVVNEAPGFVVNKILIPYCNEGVCVLQEGVASAEDIDIAMQLGCNHPMGPLHLGDLIGWDIVLNIMDVLYNETHDSKYRANVLIRKMVRAGKLGIKSGEGFFNYNK